MNTSHSIPSTVSAISFSFLSADDIRKISVKKIVNPVLLDDLNRPNLGGLYDPALGPSDSQDICATCRQTSFTCPGHFGHIELPAPVFHPLFMTNMYALLQGTCMFCHRFKMSRTVLCKYIGKLRLLERGLLDAAKAVDEINTRKKMQRGDFKDGDKDEAGDVDDLVDDESVEEFQLRVHLFVNLHLSRASTVKRDQYKDGMVYQMRKATFQAFLKDTSLKKCQNSGCYA
jgi:DNA-directed RNA polymerase beta' subunit